MLSESSTGHRRDDDASSSSGGRAIMDDDDDGGPQSLFVVVDYDFHYKGPYFCSILQLDMSEIEGNSHHENDEAIEAEFSVNFCQPQSQSGLPILWHSTLVAANSDLYMVPDMVPALAGKRDDELPVIPLQGCVYNLRNNKCKQIKPPDAPKLSGNAVCMGGHVYFMAHPREEYLSFPVFERYNPLSDCWEPRKSFPFYPAAILATAPLDDDTILFNIGHNICAYNAPNNKWYPVIIDNNVAYLIRGDAVVVGNTIYALEHECFDLVLVFSVERKEVNDDLEFRFSLVSKIFVSGMKEIKPEDEEDKDVQWPSCLRNLAYLGNDNFCIVQNCQHSSPKDYQSIRVITMKLEGENSMTVKNTRFYKLKIEGKTRFRVRLCFSLPLKCTTTAVEEGKPSVVEVDPFPKHTGTKREREGDIDCHRDHANTTLEVLNHEASRLRAQATPTSAYPAFPAYHYPRAPAIPSPPPPYYQCPRPDPPNTPQPWPSNPQQPLLHTPTAPKTNNQRPPKPYQDYCQLCGLEGHFATNCPTYTYYNKLPRPRPPWSTTVNNPL